MDTEKVVVLVIGVIAITAITLGCIFYHRETMSFIQKGYHQEQCVGSSSLIWVK